MARQHGAVLSHYHTKSGDSLELLYPGEMSAKVRKRLFKQGYIFPTFPTLQCCMTIFPQETMNLIVVETLP